MIRLRSHIPFIALLAIALVLRLYLWKHTGVALYGDMLRYDATAQHLVQSGYLGYAGVPDAFVTPGYPLFIALLYKLSSMLHGVALTHTRLIHEVYLGQQLLSLITLVLTYMLGAAIKNRWVGLAAAALSVLYLPNSYVGLLLLTEALFIPLLLATILAYVYAEQTGSAWLYGLTGVMLGFTVLVRPTVLPLIVLFVILDWWRHKRAGPWEPKNWGLTWGWMAVLLVVTLLPWWIRNAVDFHRFIPLSTEAGNPLLAGADPYFQVSINRLIQLSRVLHESQETFAIHYIIQGFSHQFFLFAGWFLFGKLPYLFWNPWLYSYLSSFVLYHRVVVVAGFVTMLVALSSPRLRAVAWTALMLLLLQLVFLPTARYGYPIIALWLIIIPATLYEGWQWITKGRIG